MSHQPTLSGTVVELHVPDFDPVRKFYTNIGFEIVWERPPEDKKGYLVARLGNNLLCFWAGNDQVRNQRYFQRFPSDTPRGYGVEIAIAVEDIDELFERVEHEDGIVQKLELREWGKRDFRMVDPFGFYLRFTEPFDISDNRYAIE